MTYRDRPYIAARGGRPLMAARPVRPWRRALQAVLLLAVVGGVVAGGVAGWQKVSQTAHDKNKTAPAMSQTSQTATNAPAATSSNANAAHAAAAHCAGNAGQNVIVSVSARHLWACNGASLMYDSAVITGMENLPADLTPTGIYHIYAKTTNTHLKGSDSTGSWDDFVNYWMPFLHNQYGTYGFHDATWRAPSDFGAISPNSSNASHGCVETPLATAKWLYGWAAVGTTVTIQS